MRGYWKFLVAVIVFFIILVSVEMMAPKKVNWHPDYTRKSKDPFGSFLVYKVLEDIFPGKEIKSTSKSVYLYDFDPGNRNFIFINTGFAPDEYETGTLLELVHNGANVFIAAEVKGPLADTFGITTGFFQKYNPKDSFWLNLVNLKLRSRENHTVKKDFYLKHFTEFDTSQTEILGINSSYFPDFIRVKHGKGYFYFHLFPLMFTNYHILSGENNDYIYKSLSYLPVTDVVWDEYYKSGRVMNKSLVRFILSDESLKWAYYLILLGLVLFVFFEAKRKQRVIPVIPPVQNTSVQFAETLGKLYYQNRDHLNLAKKKMLFFYDILRTQYQVSLIEDTNEFYSRVATKTGKDEALIREIFNKFNSFEKRKSISEGDLISLNRMLDKFYHE